MQVLSTGILSLMHDKLNMKPMFAMFRNWCACDEDDCDCHCAYDD